MKSIQESIGSARAGLSVVGLALSGIMVFLGTAAAWAGSGDPVTVADFDLPPQDAQGWTVLTPSADSRLIYVDDINGNDDTGAFHLPSDPVIGADPRAPVGAVQAFRTLGAAHARSRRGSPDWILLRAGGVWTNTTLEARHGRSPTERSVVTSYGQGPRPELRTGTLSGLAGGHIYHSAVIGIRFWAHTRDSDGPYFTGLEGSSGFGFFTRPVADTRQVHHVLIEDCVFRSYASNVLEGGASDENPPITRFVIRRSIFSGNYGTDRHSQGLYFNGSGHPLQPALLLQENLFDHNGWRIRQGGSEPPGSGQATVFNHNTYFNGTRGVIFDRNLFLRASSIGNKWTEVAVGLVIDNNLYAEGEVGISMGGNGTGPYRFQDIVVRNNVFTDIGRTQPTNRNISYGIDAQDWDGGLIHNNLLIHQRTLNGGTYAIMVTASDGATRDLHIADNVIANVRTSSGVPMIQLHHGNSVESILFENNIVDVPSASPLIGVTSGGYAFAGSNQYHSPAAPGQQFRVDGAPTDLAGWIAATGDTGATVTAPVFPDPERDLAGYIAHLGLGDSFEDFLDAVYAQSRSNWNPDLTAGAVNDWLRGGFGMASVNGDAIFSDGFESH